VHVWPNHHALVTVQQHFSCACSLLLKCTQSALTHSERGCLQDEDSDEDEDRVGGIFRKAKAIGAQQGTADDMPAENTFRGQGRTLTGGPSAQVR
jgi:hypothetical protein